MNVNILAIDPATLCGWATEHEYGTWDLKLQKDESNGMKWLRFRAKLTEICKLANIEVIVYERPAGRHMGAVIHQAKLVAIIEEHAAEHRLEYKAYSATEIKKHATGKGNCGKPAMIAAAQEKLDYEGNDDNEADALWLYDLTVSRLGLDDS